MFIFRPNLLTWLKGLTVLGIIGVLVCGAWFIHIQQFLATSVHTTGRINTIITELDSYGDLTYVPEIQFQDQRGQSHTIQTFVSGNEHDREVGEVVPVLYDPRDPSHATVGSWVEIYIGILILAILSVGMVVSGIVPWLLLKKEEQRKKDLISRGQRISAKVLDIIRTGIAKRDGQLPWLIMAAWTNPADGRKYDFTSEVLWFDPKPYLASGVINVFIEPSDPEQYVVEVPSGL